MTNNNISLKTLLRRFWKKALVTWLLVVLEGLNLLLLPLVIGWAVDDLMKGETLGIIQLGALCLLLLIIGAGRRFYDTRVYSGIYRKVSNELVTGERSRKTSISKISARTNLFTEFIKFLENSIPDIFNQFVGLVGTLGIIVFIDLNVFWACMIGTSLTCMIYLFSQKKMLDLNKGQNDEFERQVDIITSNSSEKLRCHFKNLMKWNIRLSDLETINFSLTWLVLAGVLLYSIVLVASSDNSSLGQVLSIIMYVFGFMESVMTFPLYYQQMVRLQDIATRLANPQRPGGRNSI